MIFRLFLVLCAASLAPRLLAEPIIINLWPGIMPGPAPKVTGPEADTTKPDDKLVAGKPVMRIGNVNQPQIHVFLPPKEKAHGGAVIVCPGGGFSILAWDLEGTEVAQWLNEEGFAALVVKYRVPTREHGTPGRWEGPVMDAQRALSLARNHANDWDLDPKRIGILGFSAGGETAALAAIKKGQRLYPKFDVVDEAACDANFAMLIYPGGMVENDGALKQDYAVTKDTPPMFFVHTADDPVTCLSSTALFTALKKADVASELHIYSSGGHGYGLRRTRVPVTHWSKRADDWLREMKFALPPPAPPAPALPTSPPAPAKAPQTEAEPKPAAPAQ